MTIDYSKQKDKKIAVVEKTKIMQVDIVFVIYFECDEHLIYIFHTNGEQPYHCTNTIKKLEAELKGIGFVRICRKRLVNMRYVQLCCSEKRQLHFYNGHILTVSRRKWHNVIGYFRI